MLNEILYRMLNVSNWSLKLRIPINCGLSHFSRDWIPAVKSFLFSYNNITHQTSHSFTAFFNDYCSCCCWLVPLLTTSAADWWRLWLSPITATAAHCCPLLLPTAVCPPPAVCPETFYHQWNKLCWGGNLKRKQESKRTRKLAFDQESDQEKERKNDNGQ